MTNKIYKIVKNYILENIRNTPTSKQNHPKNNSDIKNAAIFLRSFVSGLRDAPASIKQDAFETIELWLERPETTLQRDPFDKGEEKKFWADVTNVVLESRKKLIPDTLSESMFPQLADTILSAFPTDYEQAFDNIKRVASICIPDKSERDLILTKFYIDRMAARLAAELDKNNETASAFKIENLLKQIKPANITRSQDDSTNQVYFDRLRTLIESAVQKGLLADSRALEFEASVADILLSPSQRLVWVKDLTDDNMNLTGDNLESQRTRPFLGFLIKEFSEALSLQHGKTLPTISTGQISAGYIHGDLVIFFHAASKQKAEKPGILLTQSQSAPLEELKFESVDTARKRFDAPVSLFKSVQLSASEEFDAVVHANENLLASDAARPSVEKKASRSTPKARRELS